MCKGIQNKKILNMLLILTECLVKTSLVELISLGHIPFNFLISFIARCHLTLQLFLLLVLVMPYRFHQIVIQTSI